MSLRSVSRFGEFGLISLIRRWTRDTSAPSLLRGLGDDCATIRTTGRTLFKTDALVENVHFKRAWATPSQIGWKALAANVSDIVAAGGTPTAALISLELPGSTPVAWVRSLYAGFSA